MYRWPVIHLAMVDCIYGSTYGSTLVRYGSLRFLHIFTTYDDSYDGVVEYASWRLIGRISRLHGRLILLDLLDGAWILISLHIGVVLFLRFVI